MRRKTVTIRDVAKLAGVGVSTVSYVLNGRDDHVGADTRNQILAAARELNYRPNAIARSMVKQQTAIIGLAITELDNPLFV
ncbi:MAG TPA: LacI family DNA-binding transcriptional regulator, partial [Aggregatilineales bacterium]|nr:LacI family DNA-binding transcriptional regulator [Aggregatilineales bacterium]